MNQHLLTTHEVAEALRVSPETIRNLIARGELSACRIGRVYRVPRESVEQLVERTTNVIAA